MEIYNVGVMKTKEIDPFPIRKASMPTKEMCCVEQKNIALI